MGRGGGMESEGEEKEKGVNKLTPWLLWGAPSDTS